MPTVVREDGFSIRIYAPPREHPPPHVHVYKAGELVIIELGVMGEPPTVRGLAAMSPSEVFKALRLVEQRREILIAAWEELHGKAESD